MLKNKIAVVTGGGRGIGKASAVLLAKNGAEVIVLSRSQNELDDTVNEIVNGEGKASAIRCDISNEGEIVSTFAEIEKKFGRIDILLNSAGIFKGGLLKECSATQFSEVLNVNCTGLFLCCRESHRLMKKNGGSIVNISSLGGIRSVEKFPGFGAYSVSKFGVIGLTEVMAVEWKEDKIRVNAIAPGAVDTAMLNKAAPNLYPRLSPRQVGEMVVFLASEKASGMTGSTVELFSHLQE